MSCFSWCECFSFLYPEDPRVCGLRNAREEMKAMINTRNCNPILVRLAWHDSGTYDQRIQEWPQRGGANGGNWYKEQLDFGANAGLEKARDLVKPFFEKYPHVGQADLMQMASALSIELAGGPKIDMKYGRWSVASGDCCVKPKSREGFAGNAGLPDGEAPFGCGAATPAEHLRNVFGKKMGFTDQEIVAISGAHTIGRVFKERSGACPFGYGNANASKYTKDDCIARRDGAKGIGMAGGQAWTKNWLTFDNSYFTQPKDEKGYPLDKDLVWLATDACLWTDPVFKQTAELYAKDQDAFFRDYATAHKKLSELGAHFDPPEGLKLPE
eukprot:CAMPEP_0180419268 /NCGR_PEP_ID=MMETSP1036_2-20121128/2002_1 /TAXON_ID=632150 /ORGANISM="Azadinium spinosum, Strain 3D9" /LENGTH=326 /DNA_ID=CAMNT_0022424405 /DNA_START=72 /DNA_END=1050 /DNA_ORIENTATION=+